MNVASNQLRLERVTTEEFCLESFVVTNPGTIPDASGNQIRVEIGNMIRTRNCRPALEGEEYYLHTMLGAHIADLGVPREELQNLMRGNTAE